MINRTIPPDIRLTEHIDFPTPQPIVLSNSSKLLIVNEGDVDVCRIDLIFDAGSRYQKQKLEASASISMLPEGTKIRTSQQISEYFDFWGSFINIGVDKDFARITAYSLTKHLQQTLEMLEEIVKQPTFPASELEVWCRRGKQSLTVEMDKTSTLARMEFFKSIYGLEHPYGAFALPTDYDAIQTNKLQDFYSTFLGSSGATIVLSGKISESHIKLVEKYFGNYSWGRSGNREIFEISSEGRSGGNFFVSKPEAVQSAIRVGRELFKRSHPDYPDMMVLNTILGGYFGSRLMKNIREEKGYTYGIGSYVIAFRDSGAFAISTEVGSQYTSQTLDEIAKEIKKLRQELVSNEELSLVRSYLMGEALRSFNGPFATADNIIGLLNFNQLDYNFYNKLFHSIKTITPQRIIELANKWLDDDTLVKCVAGSVNPFS